MSYVTPISLKVKVKYSCARVYHEALWRNGSTAPCSLDRGTTRGERSASLHDRFNPGKTGPDIRCIGAKVRHRAGLTLWGKEKSLVSVGNQRMICRLQQTRRPCSLHGSEVPQKNRNIEYTVGYFGLGSILPAEGSIAGYLGVTSLIIRGTLDYRVMGEPPLVVFAFHDWNILKMDEEMWGLKQICREE